MAGKERNLSTRGRIEIRDCDATMSNIADLPTPRRFSITRSIALVSSSKRGRLRVGGRRQTPPFPSKNHDRPRRRDRWGFLVSKLTVSWPIFDGISITESIVLVIFMQRCVTIDRSTTCFAWRKNSRRECGSQNIKYDELFAHYISVANTFNLLIYNFYVFVSTPCAFARWENYRQPLI